MKKQLFLAATAIIALASCSSDEFVGDNSPDKVNTNETAAITFGSSSKGLTRADHVGADAAKMLNEHFTVGGFKGTYTDEQDLSDVTIATGKVFDNYVVNWKENTAAKTESNTSDWEYVGTTAVAPSAIAGNIQSIKYWDYSATQYDFIAYSTGKAAAVTTAPSDKQVQVTAINPATVETAAYTLTGKAADLKDCYIADMVTVYKDGTKNTHYGDEVKLTFRSLASKVRVAIYETVPGYSVKDVKFYVDDATTPISTGASETDAYLFTTGTENKDNFYTEGTYTVKFPNIGKANKDNSDYNKAHVAFAQTGKTTTMAFDGLNLVGRDYKEAELPQYIGRTSSTASFAGTASPDNYYKTALPNEDGTILELRVDYTLLSIDGSGEEIKVYGAKAFVPAIYAAWKPNYAYTYIFKISDNTNGWTSKVNTDPTGLYPITFDAVVLDSEDATQSTITNVSSPSITTYQVGHVYNDADPDKDGTPKDEYLESKGKIYIQVISDGTLKGDLGTYGQLYTVTAREGKTITEADVMDALNLGTLSGGVLTGRNEWVLTETASDATQNVIPGADGNNISITAGQAAEFTPSAGTTYAYTYDTQTYGGDYYPVKPADWDTNYASYYTNADCADDHKATSTFTAGTYYKKDRTIRTYVELNEVPGDWVASTSNVYYTDEACTNKITSAYANPSASYTEKPADWPTGYYTESTCTTAATKEGFTSGTTYYRKLACYRMYTADNKIYGVKVIKVK